MSIDEAKYSVSFSWKCSDSNISVKDIISLEDISNSDWMQLRPDEIEQSFHWNVDGLSLLNLVRSNQNEACALNITLEDYHLTINRIIVISEARIIEIHGKHDEYLCTEKPHYLGSTDDKKFYIAQVDIPPTKEVTLKFCENCDTLALYGITLLLSRNQPSTSNSTIDFTNVETILKNSNVNLSENAERAKKFIMDYCLKKNTTPSAPKEEMLQSLIHKWTSLGLGNNITKLIPSSKVSGDISKYSKDNCDEDIKGYVDEKLLQLEERVQNNLQLQLKEFEQKQNEKLDNIIKLLQDK